jgi:hypothetical protein
MSQLAVCLVEFLAFLGIPYLRQLQRFIAVAIAQLRVLQAEALSQLAFTDVASQAINQAIGTAQLVASEVQNTLGSLPLGAFQDCAPAANLVGTLRDSFDGVLGFFDEATNEANRVRTFSNLTSIAASEIDEQITYLENLNDQIDIIILDELRKQAEAL